VDAYRVLIKPSAVKELEAIPKEGRNRISPRIGGLAANPRPPGCEKLSEDKYRVRQGDYRVIFLVNDESPEVIVFKIGHGREVYQ